MTMKKIMRWLGILGRCECPCGGEAVRVARISDISDDRPFCATAAGKKVVVVRTGGRYYAHENACSHKGGPLCEGRVENGTLVCPWHGAAFRLDTGEPVKGPAEKAVAVLPIEVRGDDLYVRLPADKGSSKPQSIKLTYTAEFDRERPFRHEPFVSEVLAGLKFPFKLHGVLPLVAIAQNDDELDFDLGGIHATEVDLKKMTALMDALNAKWGTAVTFCLYQSSQFPGDMLLNVRGFKAPPTTDNDIKF